MFERKWDTLGTFEKTFAVPGLGWFEDHGAFRPDLVWVNAWRGQNEIKVQKAVTSFLGRIERRMWSVNEHIPTIAGLNQVHSLYMVDYGERTHTFLALIFADNWSEECVTLPGKPMNNGYHWIAKNYAHRYMCEWKHGPPPSPAHVAAHSCGVKHCINPKHIRWATHQENMDDKYVHNTLPLGEDHWTTTLKNEQVLEIRRLYAEGCASMPAIARMFGISTETARSIIRRRTWAHI